MALTSGLSHTPLVDKEGYMSQEWQVHFREQVTAIAAAPAKEDVTQLPPQSGAIGFAALPVTGLAPGLYRVSVSIRIVAPAGVTSTLGPVVLLWTDGAVPCSQTVIPALTTNTAATVASGAAMIRADANTPIGYSVGYASNPANAMTYDLRIVLESMGGA